MTNDSALINIGTSQKILRALLVIIVGQIAADELVSGVVTSAAPVGLAGDLKTVKAIFDGAPTTFVGTQQNVDDLDDVVDGITAIEVGDFATEAGNAYDELQAASPDA